MTLRNQRPSLAWIVSGSKTSAKALNPGTPHLLRTAEIIENAAMPGLYVGIILAFPTLPSQKLASVSFLFHTLVTEVYIFAQNLYFRRMSKGGMLAVAH
jgi:hypothetical protein